MCTVLQINPYGWHKRGILMILYELFTWHCCNSSQAAGCRSWFVGVNLHSDSVPHNMWSVVCKVDLKRIRRGRGCDHWGRRCNCGCVRCSETCQEKINLQTHSATLPASLSNNLFSSHKDGIWRVPIELNLNQTIYKSVGATTASTWACCFLPVYCFCFLAKCAQDES